MVENLVVWKVALTVAMKVVMLGEKEVETTAEKLAEPMALS